MRWPFRILAGLLALWAVYAVSPYLALYDLVRAVERGDTDLVAARVNFRALRVSLAKELVDGYLVETDTDGRITPAERQAATGIVATLGDPLLASFVTPEGLMALLRMRAGTEAPAGDEQRPLLRPDGWGDLFAMIARSQTRGFRNIYFTLPPRAPPGERFRVQLRLSRLEWKVVNVELPPPLKQRLARRLATASEQRR